MATKVAKKEEALVKQQGRKNKYGRRLEICVQDNKIVGKEKAGQQVPA